MKLVFVVNNAGFFVSHRLPIALAARKRGDEVAVVTGQAGSPTAETLAVERLRAEGIAHFRCAFTSTGINPLVEARGFLQLVRHLRSLRPDVVHCASPKGGLYGGLAARLVQVPALVLAVSGMGYAYTSAADSLLRKLLRAAYSSVARYSFGHRNKRVIVQNEDDYAAFAHAGLAGPGELVLIPGSGVEIERFVAPSMEQREDIVLLPARMLRDKGVEEFATAARVLHGEFPGWKFMLAGAADYRNPSAIPESVLHDWHAQGHVQWLGIMSDMPALYARTKIVCLPSYREGMPKSLLEAAASGCAVVTTDAVGCRESIMPGVSGDLVPVGDAAAVAGALRALMRDPGRLASYGEAGVEMARAQFDVRAVVARVLSLYDELLQTLHAVKAKP